MNPHKFQIVCTNCDCIGVQLDFPEGAPSSTTIRCATCGSHRGTLGGLRSLAMPDQDSLLDVIPEPPPAGGKERRRSQPRRAADKSRNN